VLHTLKEAVKEEAAWCGVRGGSAPLPSSSTPCFGFHLTWVHAMPSNPAAVTRGNPPSSLSRLQRDPTRPNLRKSLNDRFAGALFAASSLSLSLRHSLLLSLWLTQRARKKRMKIQAQLTAWAVPLRCWCLFFYILFSRVAQRERLMAKNSRPALTFYEMLSAPLSA
jgi:hypothetical protein